MWPGMMPILHLPGEMMPGQLGPIRRVLACSRGSARRLTMSMTGMPSVMQTTSGMPASAASMMASAANGGGTKITVALAPVAFTASRDGVEHGALEMLCAALAGRDAADDVGAVGDRLLRVEGAFLAGEALNDQACVFVDQYAHCAPPARATTFSRGVLHAVGDGEVQAGFVQDLLAQFDVGAFHADHDRNFDVQIARRGDHAGGERVAAQDAAENIDEARLSRLDRDSRMRKAFLTCSALAPPPTSRKFAGLPPAYLMMSMVAMARPAPLTMQATLPSSLM